MPWRRLASVRARITVLATLFVAAALAAGAIALLLTLQASLSAGRDEAAKTRVRDLAALARTNALPPTLTVTQEDFAQVVDAAGQVVAASENVRGRAPVATFVPGEGEPEVRRLRAVADGQDLEDFRVWAVRTEAPEGPRTIYVGVNLESVRETTGVVRATLLAGLPPLLALLSVGTWLVVGRALRPVEAIRAEVSDISGHDLSRRVPVPPAIDELGRLARTMNEMLDRLQAASERERRFIADAAHELQSPLAAFRAHLEVAQAHPDRDNWQPTVAELLAGSRDLERLVRDLLFLARSDATADATAAGAAAVGAVRGAGRRRTAVPVDFDDVVLDEAARVRAGGRIRVDTSRVSAAPVSGSRDELTRLARNLLENAERHAATTVRVELATDDGHVRLVVADDGPGVPEADRERIFDRFARLDDARSRASGGTGLGLAIVKDIAEHHGGTVRLDGSAGGARFVVQLPSGHGSC
jgi:signal transduction histidine kinase